MLRVLSDRVSGGEPHGFVDTTAVREDLPDATQRLSLHDRPAPGSVAKEQHHSLGASLVPHLRPPIAAPVLNCRTFATSWSKLDRGQRSFATPSGIYAELCPPVPYDPRDAPDPRLYPLRSLRWATREIPDGTHVWS